MSGYLDVKYPLKSNIGLNPFKTWKRQWCILRPSPILVGGGSLAVYCSEAGAAAGCIDFPPGCIIRRAKSRSRPHAFAVFSPDELRKPRALLAASSVTEAQLWMDKIKALLNGNKLLGTEILLKDTFTVSVLETVLSTKCGLGGTEGTVKLSPNGLSLVCGEVNALVPWTSITDVEVDGDTKDAKRICALTINSSKFPPGGLLRLRSASPALGTALRARGTASRRASLGDEEERRGSWSCGPAGAAQDDTDLALAKSSRRPRQSRCPAGELPRSLGDSSFYDRRSMISIASGIYEEIPDLPAKKDSSENDDVDVVDGPVTGVTDETDVSDNAASLCRHEEPTYESVAECVYATMRRAAKRHPPPPLPPRLPFGTMKLGESWSSRMNKCAEPGVTASVTPGVTRHSSLGSLPRCCAKGKDKPRAFSVFRKRLKSDSRLATKPADAKENKDLETKKKRFDFVPTGDFFRSFKVGRKMKGLKLTNAGNLSKIGETKSCEFLDEPEPAAAGRCSRSVDCLADQSADRLADLSSDSLSDSLSLLSQCGADLSLPRSILELVLRRPPPEDDYMPMSPGPAPEHHYIAMSPRTNIA